MRIHWRTPKGGAHLSLIVERQEHYQTKIGSDRWITGWMESDDDTRADGNRTPKLIEPSPGQGEPYLILYRPVFRSRFQFCLVLGNVCFEINRFGRFSTADEHEQELILSSTRVRE